MISKVMIGLAAAVFALTPPITAKFAKAGGEHIGGQKAGGAKAGGEVTGGKTAGGQIGGGAKAGGSESGGGRTAAYLRHKPFKYAKHKTYGYKPGALYRHHKIMPKSH